MVVDGVMATHHVVTALQLQIEILENLGLCEQLKLCIILYGKDSANYGVSVVLNGDMEPCGHAG